MSLNLSNPKRFLPLLLFIGFVFALFGMGWLSIGGDTTVYVTGWLTMIIAVFLWILINRRRLDI